MSYGLQILGGIGVFLVGLRLMSTGLQKLAGNRLRAILSGLTKNRFTGILTGFLVTTAVQSSSATTVLVVSFANAGLLTLAQAIGLVMGANIGTTVTGWLVSLLGFKVKIEAFALPVIGLGFPLSLMRSHKARQLSEVMIGFGLLFLGLKFLKDGVPDLKSNPEALAFLQNWADYGFASIVLFVLVGTALTIIVQSSSATMAITLAMAYQGWIGYDIAAAMVLGENIGTTITASLAAVGANRSAKRVARSHTLFNVIGVLWMLILLRPFLGFIDAIVPGDPTDPTATPTHLAAFHTSFNILNTLLLVGFVKHIERLVYWLVPRQAGEAEGSHFRFLETGLLSTPELAEVEARRGLQAMVGVCVSMFDRLREVITHPRQKLGAVVDEIKRGEAKTDEMEEELVQFCAELARSGSSARLGRDVTTFLDLANDIERMGDHCMNLVLLAQRRYEKKYDFSEATQRTLIDAMDVTRRFLALAHDGLAADAESILAEAKLLESKINKLRDQARKRHAQAMQAGEVGVREGLIFLDMMSNLEKLGDYCFNIAQRVEHLRDEE